MPNQYRKPIYFQAFYHHPKSEVLCDVAYCTLHIICFVTGLYSRKQTLSFRVWRELGQSFLQILELDVYIFMRAFSQKRGLICVLCAVYVYFFCVVVEVAW